MYTKKDDKNLRISQIHHKRKENLNRHKKKLLNMALVILIIGIGTVIITDGEEGIKIKSGIVENKSVENKSVGFAQSNGYQLVWGDEFNSMNSNFWSPRYTGFSAANVKVDNGNLILSVTKNAEGKVRGGGVITLDKYNYKYGYIEVRAKVAKGKGLTTGFWLTGQIHYPPELDIMEYIGKDPTALYLSRHCSTNNDPTCDGWNQFPSRPWWLFWTKRYVEGDWSRDYHLYGMEWTPSYIKWIVDDVERYRVNTGVAQEPMWITLSACGNKCLGKFDGPIDGTTPLPAKSYIDYVRIYQKAGGGQTDSGVTVITPNGGEILEKGTTKKINWGSKGNIGSYVKVELLKGGKLNKVISPNTLNDGSYDWSIPSTQIPGTDYKIKISSTSKPVADTSNGNFIISPIVVISPNGGESLRKGTAKTIRWSSTGPAGSIGNVKIELYKGRVLSRIISSNTQNDGSYSWTIPSKQMTGTNYKIKITSIKNPAYKDTSNNYFKIY